MLEWPDTARELLEEVSLTPRCARRARSGCLEDLFYLCGRCGQPCRSCRRFRRRPLECQTCQATLCTARVYTLWFLLTAEWHIVALCGDDETTIASTATVTCTTVPLPPAPTHCQAQLEVTAPASGLRPTSRKPNFINRVLSAASSVLCSRLLTNKFPRNIYIYIYTYIYATI